MSLATHLASLVQTIAADIKSLRIRSAPRVVPAGALATRRRCLPAITSSALSTVVSAVNRLWLIPFIAPDIPEITRLTVYVSTASSSNIQLGLYNNSIVDGVNAPYEVLRASPIDTAATTGEHGGTIEAIKLTAGDVYWCALWTAASPNLRAIPVASMSYLLGNSIALGYTPVACLYTTATGVVNLSGYSFTEATNAPPAIFAGFN